MEGLMIIKIVILLVLIWIGIYSFSFGVWTWRHRNKFGGMVVMCLALTAVVLPGFILFFTHV
jgi:hypothetical protein